MLNQAPVSVGCNNLPCPSYLLLATYVLYIYLIALYMSSSVVVCSRPNSFMIPALVTSLAVLLTPVYWTSLSCYYSDVITGVMASQIISLRIVYWTVYSGADQRKHQSPASLAFVGGIQRWPVNSQHKWPVTRTMFSFDYVIMRQNVRKWIAIETLSTSTALYAQRRLRRRDWQ